MAERMPEKTRLMVLLGILLVVVVAGVWMRFFKGGGSGRAAVGETPVEFSSHDIPDLEIARLEGQISAEDVPGRNPFAWGVPPTPTPDYEATRTYTPPPTPVPRTPRPTATPDPNRTPPPPRFERLYLGNFGPQRLPVVVFRNGEKVEIAVPGMVLDDKFVVRGIGLESVEIGFVGYPEEVSTRVPLAED